jgi:hypothetical protein
LTLALLYQGFDYVSYYNGAFEDADSLGDLAQTGANAVALNLQYGIDSVNSISYADPDYTDSLDALSSTIQEALGYGLSVMVRPLIDFVDPARHPDYDQGEWRAYFNPSDPDAFFASYNQILLAMRRSRRRTAHSRYASGRRSTSSAVPTILITGPISSNLCAPSTRAT